MGRSILGRGEFASVDQLDGERRRDPFAYRPGGRLSAPPLPVNLLNRASIRAFNELWFRKAPKRRRGELQTIPQFFHPLDDIVLNWNRLYGPRGFLQWQPVVPFGREDVLEHIVERLSTSGCSSFLAVLKRFGAGNGAPLSFPIAGWTLSLDLPAGARGLGPLLDELDVVVADAGGRVYLAKDSRVRPDVFARMYPRLDEWRAVRDRVDPHHVLQSDQARRLRMV
jgi:decaprenylphospho-beta-D-ribofuranose 2-oxidase